MNDLYAQRDLARENEERHARQERAEMIGETAADHAAVQERIRAHRLADAIERANRLEEQLAETRSECITLRLRLLDLEGAGK